MKAAQTGGFGRPRRWLWSIARLAGLVVWVSVGLAGCTNGKYALGFGVVHASHPSLNPFSAALISEPDIETSPPRYGKVVFLLHGWHGDPSSFGDLAGLLQRDRIETHAVYSLSYWSNLLGPNFRKIEDFGESLTDLLETTIHRHNLTEVAIVAHSMGGLIARDALLRLRERGLAPPHVTIRLILVTTPTRGADLAIWYDRVIGGITAPVTFVSSLLGSVFGLHTSLVWDRQAHDMRHLNVVNHQPMLPPVFIADQTVRWHDQVKSNTRPAPHLFAVIGVPTANNQSPPDAREHDSIVRAVDVPFNHVPMERRCYVAQRHWDGIANITTRAHPVYGMINTMLDADLSAPVVSICQPQPMRRPTWIVVVRDPSEVVGNPADVSGYQTKMSKNEDAAEDHNWWQELMGGLADISYGLFASPLLVEAANNGASRHKEVLGSYLINQNVESCRRLSVKAVKEGTQGVQAEFVLVVAGAQSDCAGQSRLDVALGMTNILSLHVGHVGGIGSVTLCNGTPPCVESRLVSVPAAPAMTVNTAGEAGQ